MRIDWGKIRSNFIRIEKQKQEYEQTSSLQLQLENLLMETINNNNFFYNTEALKKMRILFGSDPFFSNFYLDVNGDICHVDGPMNPVHPECRTLIFNENNYTYSLHNNNIFVPPVDAIIFLRRLLELRKELGDIWTYTRFKHRNALNDCIYDHPERFNIFDGNLCIQGIGNEKISFIHEKNYNKLLKNEVPKATIKEFRAIRRLIEDSIQTYHKSNILSAIETHKKILMKDILICIQEKYDMAKKILTERFKYEPQPIQVRVLQGDKVFNKSDFEKYREQLQPYINRVPEKVVHVIASMVDGDIENIDKLAKMIAQINIGHNISKNMFVIIGKKNMEFFGGFIYKLYFQNEIDLFFVEDVKKTKYYISAIEKKYWGLLVQLILPTKSIANLSEEYFKLINKMVLSQPIKGETSNGFGKINFVNEACLVAFVRKAKELNRYKMYMGTRLEILDLGNSEFEYVEGNMILSSIDIIWTHVILATYGLTLHFDKKKSRKKESYIKERIVKDFIDCCCTVSPTVDCYNDELYKAYSDYFTYRFHLEPIKKTELKRLITLYCDIKPCRPRHGLNENRRGVRGISIDKDKLAKYLSVEEEDKEQKVKIVAEYLHVINDKMVNLLGINTCQ